MLNIILVNVCKYVLPEVFEQKKYTPKTDQPNIFCKVTFEDEKVFTTKRLSDKSHAMSGIFILKKNVSPSKQLQNSSSF